MSTSLKLENVKFFYDLLVSLVLLKYFLFLYQ